MNLSIWSKDYQSAKEKFNERIVLLKNKGFSVEHTQLDIKEKGPNGDNLYIDALWIGKSDSNKLYMSTSGIHGVEGFAGSAIQLSILDKLNSIPDKTALAFIHILNPWGMSWIRRENESNVDLNRNFLEEGEKYLGSHEHYIKLNPLINIEYPASQKDFFGIKMLLHAMLNGKTKTKQAYAEGQYDFPKGLHFGGHKLEKGPFCFIDWLKAHLGDVKDCVWTDLHTGLGESGEDSLLVDLAPDHEKFINLKEQPFGNRIMSLDPTAGVAYKIRGGMQKGIGLLFPNTSWTSITQEFGTIKSVNVIKALRAENSWTHYGNLKNSSLLNHWSKKDVLNAFRPQDKSWEEKIENRGNILFQQSMDYLSQLMI